MSRIPVFSSCLLLLTCLLSSCSDNMGAGSPATARIVCVGLDYKNSSVPTLPGTVADATEVCACLERIYAEKGVECSSVLMLCEGENPDTESDLYPSATNIRKTLSSLSPQSGDLVVLYWSGHGQRDSRGMFLAAAGENGSAYSALYAPDLLEWAKSLPCSVVLVLDSCYAGNAVENSSSGFAQSLKTLTESSEIPNVCVLAACAPESLSYITSVPSEDGPSRAHSVFTASLLKVLGWQCSAEYTTQTHGRTAEGYLGSLPARVNTASLLELVRRDMKKNFESEKQVPETTGTAFPVFLVP